jgi:ATP-dependent helicase/nuclease subunit A
MSDAEQLSLLDIDLAQPPAAAPPATPAPTTLTRQLIMASAGSGKTFRISTQLIALVAAGEAPDAIFASTFTRKAAGEILDRVLSRLAGAALCPQAAAELAGHVRDIGATAGTEPAYWLDVLQRLVPQLHRLNIGTLDAFFVRTARSFAFELGLPPDWSIADDAANDRMYEEAMQDLLGTGDDAALTQMVQDMARGRATRAVHDSISRRIRHLVYMHHAIDPAARSAAWGGLGSARAAAAAPADRQRLADELAAAEVPLTKTGTPNSTWAKALDRAANAIRAADWPALIGEKLFLAAADRSSYAGHPVPGPIADVMARAHSMAREDMHARYATEAHALDRLSTIYAEALERRRRASGRYGFDDLTRALGGPDGIIARPDLAYRLDARARHILLDEFQDTSLSQYQAVQPLLEELVSGHEGERAALVVADPKQSIYGWRGGSPEIVDAARDRHHLDVHRLAKSWRSSQVILDFVNVVAQRLPDIDMWATDPVGARVAREWLAAFTPHAAAKPSLPGHVRMEAGAFDEGRGEDRPRLIRYAAERVAELHQRMPAASIAVLTRRNVTVTRMMLELRRAGVHASEEGGNPLTDAAAVVSVLALFRMADHPGNTVVRYHVANTPVGAALGYTDHRDSGAARDLAGTVRRELLHDGYGATVARIVDLIRPACDERELRRTSQLVELAWRYDADASLRPSDFVRWVESVRVEDPVAARVRVMTVHQAKGLEFDIVVLPELNAELERPDYQRPIAWSPGPAQRPVLAFPYITNAARKLLDDVPHLEDAVDQGYAARLRDGLSLLYVGLTRARHALHVILAPDGPNGPGVRKCAARILREAVCQPQTRADEGEVLYQTGSGDWYRQLGEPETVAPERLAHRSVQRVVLEAGGRRRRALPRRSPSELEGGSRTDLSLVLRLGAAPARDRGSIVHLWFERIGWLEDGVPTDGELSGLAHEIDPDIQPDAVSALTERFRAWLDSPGLTTLLSRPGVGADATVECEVPFLHRDGDLLMEGVIDRLVLEQDGEAVRRATIIDYKTDAVTDPASVAHRSAHYAPQLHAYRRAVAAMYGMRPNAVSARLVFLEAGLIVDPDALPDPQ